MHVSGSFLLTVLERIRAYINEPDLDAKFSNDFITRHTIMPAMVDIFARLNMGRDDPVLIRFSIPLVKDQEYYQLPPAVGSIWRVAIINDQGRITSDFLPRGEYHPRGPNWSIEGNLLTFRPFPTADREVDVWYVHTGDMFPHYATGGQLDNTLRVFNLDYTPTIGAIDRRPNAYAGQVLRLLPTNGIWEERIILSHDPVAGTVTTRVAFTTASEASSSSTSSTETMTYEIAPAGAQPLYEAIAAWGAIKLGTGLRISQAHRNSILLQYKAAMKTAQDNVGNLQLRTGKSFDRNTTDSDLLRRL